jgi:hypothetical protein
MKLKISPKGNPSRRRRTAKSNCARPLRSILARTPPAFAGESKNTRCGTGGEGFSTLFTRGTAITTRFAASLGDGLPFGILNFTLAQNLGDASRHGCCHDQEASAVARRVTNF